MECHGLITGPFEIVYAQTLTEPLVINLLLGADYALEHDLQLRVESDYLQPEVIFALARCMHEQETESPSQR